MGSIDSTSLQARLLCRENRLTNTSGVAPGYLQADLLILPAKHATDFHNLCSRNPVACPLLGMTSVPGDPHRIKPANCIQSPDFDVRTDFPKYRVYKSGKHCESRLDISDLWTHDHVAFLIGCSFSFEDALVAAGLTPRHQETGSTRVSSPGGHCIVSMRPYIPEQIESVREITRTYLSTHGEPVAWGWEGAKELGILDIDKPDFGEPQQFKEGEVPVFWACGVSPQIAVEAAGDRLDGLVFAHEPGHMLVTDWTAGDLEKLRSGGI
ncbi:uncharacterized protein N7483_002970 [Penicillium malachiteum]|uniref:uncharacterized protein n=1 Tax=Penicillium malachiteum TaxID=1324776 RepID=UPI002547837A|nr:uncharacterized protein N7483_002970 [Penicillium malachiteum]KAJ5737845.1 hypothetical protein N7483_002970 [Penicillium malachiteum]